MQNEICLRMLFMINISSWIFDGMVKMHRKVGRFVPLLDKRRWCRWIVMWWRIIKWNPAS